jgi:hypothetical protein
MIEIRAATSADALELAQHMREADRQEVWAAERRTPLEALRFAMQVSEFCRCLRIDGEVAMLWGVARIIDQTWNIWLLTADVVDRKPLAFWRTFRSQLVELVRTYPVLCNMVDARYTKALEALRRVGFTVYPADPYGVDDQPFHFCIIRRAENANGTGTSAQGCSGEARKERQAEEAKGRYLERGARPLRVRRAQKERLETSA